MTAGAKGITIKDIGAIESMVVPANWIEAAKKEVIGGRQLRQFHLFKRPDIRFCSYLRTLPLSRPAAAAFQQVIYADLHTVSQTELETLDSILESMSNAKGFQIIDATTNYLNSHRVLSVRGRWLKMLEETVSCFLDVNGDGQYVQQIYFTAPQGEFDKYARIADEIFVSIEWKRKQ